MQAAPSIESQLHALLADARQQGYNQRLAEEKTEAASPAHGLLVKSYMRSIVNANRAHYPLKKQTLTR